MMARRCGVHTITQSYLYGLSHLPGDDHTFVVLSSNPIFCSVLCGEFNYGFIIIKLIVDVRYRLYHELDYSCHKYCNLIG